MEEASYHRSRKQNWQGDFVWSRNTLDPLLRERRGMTADMAIRLSRVFKTTPDIWMNLQKAVDLWDAAQANKDQYAKLKPIAA